MFACLLAGKKLNLNLLVVRRLQLRFQTVERIARPFVGLVILSENRPDPQKHADVPLQSNVLVKKFLLEIRVEMVSAVHYLLRL